jgi:hypothetical protein
MLKCYPSGSAGFIYFLFTSTKHVSLHIKKQLIFPHPHFYQNNSWRAKLEIKANKVHSSEAAGWATLRAYRRVVRADRAYCCDTHLQFNHFLCNSLLALHMLRPVSTVREKNRSEKMYIKCNLTETECKT